MTILFCYATVLVIAVTTVFLIGSVVWHEFAGVHAFRIVCPDCDGYGGFEDEDCDTCEGSGAVDDDEFDDTEAWDRGHDEWIDRAVGL